MAYGIAAFRHQLRQLDRHGVNGGHAVVQEQHLSAARPFAQQCFADQGFVLALREVCLNLLTTFGRDGEGGDVAQARDGHVQRARDWRRRKRQQVHLGAQLLEVLLVGHAKALLFIHHDEAQALEADVFRQDAVGADQDVDFATRHLL